MKFFFVATWGAMLIYAMGEHGTALAFAVIIAYLDALLDSERRREARRKKSEL